MDVITILFKILFIILGVLNYVSYEKTNNIKDYIAYWGCMILAILS